MGTSPPSAQAVELTDNTGLGGPPGPRPPPGAPAGACAIANADDDITMIAESKLCCINFIRIFVLKKVFL
jgi:hypothetical protein